MDEAVLLFRTVLGIGFRPTGIKGCYMSRYDPDVYIASDRRLVSQVPKDYWADSSGVRPFDSEYMYNIRRYWKAALGDDEIKETGLRNPVRMSGVRIARKSKLGKRIGISFT